MCIAVNAFFYAIIKLLIFLIGVDEMSSKDDNQRNDIFSHFFSHLDLDKWDWDLSLDNFDWGIDLDPNNWDWDLNLDNFNWNVDLDFRNWDWDIKLMDKLMEDMPLLDITDF